jgi:hypothetical protein
VKTAANRRKETKAVPPPAKPRRATRGTTRGPVRAEPPPPTKPDRRLAAIVGAALVIGVVVGVTWRSEHPKAPARAPVGAAAAAAWTRIAETLESEVPARLLLGGEGDDARIEGLLPGEGLDRSAFDRIARTLARTGDPTDEAMRDDAWASAFEDFPLPEGVEVEAPVREPPPDPSPAVEEARALVRRLVARLPVESH